MAAIVLTFLFFACVVVGFAFVGEPVGRALLAAGVCGLLVLEARERASG